MSRHFTISNMCDNDQELGFQSFFKVFTQISPDGTATLGWNIFVKKYPKPSYSLKLVLPLGGFYGNSESTTNLHLKIPPS
jgi:hypothetical protein